MNFRLPVHVFIEVELTLLYQPKRRHRRDWFAY